MIVIDAISAREGGGRTYIYNLIEHLPDEAYERIIVLVLPEWKELKEKFQRLNIKYVPQYLSNPFARAIWQRCKLPNLLNGLNAGLLFVPGGVTSTIPPIGCKLVTMSRNMLPFDKSARKGYPLGWQRTRNFLLWFAMSSTLARADFVIFVSDYAYSVINKSIGGGVKNKVIIPHGVNEIFRSCDANQASGLNFIKGNYLLYVSTIDFYKSQCEVVAEFNDYIKASNSEDYLVFVGSANKQYLRKLESVIDECKVNGRVLILGKVEYQSLPTIYRNARAIIFASRVENCPNVLLESMAAGRPVFCSRVQPMPEFGGSGVIYFNPLEPHDLSSKLSRILSNDDDIEAWSQRAQIQSKKFEWNHSAKLTWEALFGLLI